MHVEIKEVPKYDIATYEIWVVYKTHKVKVEYFYDLSGAQSFKKGFIYGIDFNKINNLSEDFKNEFIGNYERELIKE